MALHFLYLIPTPQKSSYLWIIHIECRLQCELKNLCLVTRRGVLVIFEVCVVSYTGCGKPNIIGIVLFRLT